MSQSFDDNRNAMPAEVFAALGGRMAYVKPMRSEDVGFLSAGAPLLTSGHFVFALCIADGTPIAIADSFDSAMAEAASYQLDAVSLH